MITTHIKLISINGSEVLKLFDYQRPKVEAGISWKKEANAILFVNTLGTISNIWKQTLDGKSPKAVTDFKEFQIAALALNPQSYRFAISRV